MKLTITSIITAALISSSAFAQAYVDPSIIAQVQQQGGTINIAGDHVTITAPGDLSLSGNTLGLGTHTFDPRGGPVIETYVTYNQPLVVTGDIQLSSQEIIKMQTGADINDPSFTKQVQVNTAGINQPINVSQIETLSKLAPSAGGVADPAQFANLQLMQLGLSQ